MANVKSLMGALFLSPEYLDAEVANSRHCWSDTLSCG
jgi:hypothetical protein